MQKLAIAMATLTAAALAQSAAATEYCVVCAGPETTYRCQVEGTPADGQETDPRLQLLCISQLAKAGQHDNCSINRKPAETCTGELKIIAAPNAPLPGASPATTGADAPGATPYAPIGAGTQRQSGTLQPSDLAPNNPAHETSTDEAHTEKVPQTMEELAGQTVKNSKENLQKAGDAIGGTGNAIAGGAKQAGEKIGDAGGAVGNAAKKTWNCLTSLFSDC
jgi:hypothetical protein